MAVLLKSSFVVVVLCVIASQISNCRAAEHKERFKRTIGGTSFSRGQFPFLVLLRGTVVTRRFFGIPISHYHLYCGGVLIANQWLLSAAHCFSDDGHSLVTSNWEARLGAVRLRPNIRQRILDIVGRVTNFHELRQWEVDVDRIIIHPNYNRTGVLSNDIALVKLERPIPRRRVSYLISPIPLPPSTANGEYPSATANCVTMGWGCTARGRGPSRQARQINMPILSPHTCSHHYRPLYMHNRICAGYVGEGIGVCQGDSGSPLVCDSGDGYKLAGLVSLTSRNRPESFPAVFTAVKEYNSWIQQVMSRN